MNIPRFIIGTQILDFYFPHNLTCSGEIARKENRGLFPGPVTPKIEKRQVGSSLAEFKMENQRFPEQYAKSEDRCFLLSRIMNRKIGLYRPSNIWPRNVGTDSKDLLKPHTAKKPKKKRKEKNKWHTLSLLSWDLSQKSKLRNSIPLLLGARLRWCSRRRRLHRWSLHRLRPSL